MSLSSPSVLTEEEYYNRFLTFPRRRPGWGPGSTYLGLLILGGGGTAGLILLLLFMNGTLWEESSTTNYQFNATGIALFVILGLLGMFVIMALCVWFLMATSYATFTQVQLEMIVRRAVADFRGPVSLADALSHYDSSSAKAGDEQYSSKEEWIEASTWDLNHRLLAQRVRQAFPHVTLPAPGHWGFQHGGIVARQQLLLIHGREYLCLWGTELEQIGFSGVFYYLPREGDIVYSGTIRRQEPTSSLIRTYKAGQTATLRGGQRLHCHYSKRCFMLSFGLHQGSNMFRTACSSLFMPYWFVNYDFQSFWVQVCDFYHGFLLWLWVRLYLDDDE